MRKQDGKITLSSIIVLILVCYAAVIAVQFLTAHLTSGQIQNDIKSRLYKMQGSDFSPIEARTMIIKILETHNALYDETDIHSIIIKVDPQTLAIHFYVEYDIEIDLFLFKRYKMVDFEGSVGGG